MPVHIPMGLPSLLLAMTPVLILLVAILGFGWSVSKAAPLGMAAAFLIAACFFKSKPSALLVETGKGIWSAATILLVVWPALLSYELSCQVNGFQAICRGIQGMTQNELLQILILGWIFPSFLQGITGFGVAVAVGAPLLVSIGVMPVYSVIIVLLCHCWGGTFGTLALAWEALIGQMGMNPAQNAQAAFGAAGMIWIYNLACVLLVCRMYGGWRAVKKLALAVALLSLIMGGGELLIAPVNPTVSCFLPAAAALGAAVLLCRRKAFRTPWRVFQSKIMNRPPEKSGTVEEISFHQAFLPYYLLTGIAVVCLLIPPVKSVLSKWSVSFAFPGSVTGYGFATEAETTFSPLRPLVYAGTFLTLSDVLAVWFYKKMGLLRRGGFRTAWLKTVKKCAQPTIAIASLLVMSKFMSSSGMIYVLSQGIVSLLGRGYILAAPFLGMLGAFITSSNMSSNILLGSLQRTAADLLSVNPVFFAMLQTVGGMLGNAFAPGCTIMGITTTGCRGKDSEILRRVLPLSVLFAAIFGLAVFLLLEGKIFG